MACAYATRLTLSRQSCSIHRVRVRQIVRNDGAGTPSSFSTRIVSAFEVGSTTRPSTNLRNTSSSTVSNPSRAYAFSSTSHNTRDALPTTVGAAVTGGPGVSASRSKACCPAWIFSLATSINEARLASSCAEPMCSTMLWTPLLV